MDTIIPQNEPSLKRCRKCGQEKPATTEFFSRHKACTYGVRSTCKDCTARANREYNSRPEVRAHNNQRSRDYEASHKDWRAAYSETQRAYRHEYDRQYHIRQREGKRAYRQRTKEHSREHDKAYRTANMACCLERERTYRRSERGRLAVYAKDHNRRARKMAAGGTHTRAEVLSLHKRQHGRCYYCGVVLGSAYHKDHIVPLSRGGSNAIDNIALACATCNLSKSNKLLHEWSAGGRLL